MMRIHTFLFCLLVAMCLVVGTVLLIAEKADSHGVAHDKFPATMQQGGSGAERHEHLRVLGWALATLQVVFMVTCLTLGVVKRRERRGPFLVVGSLFVLLFTLLMIADAAYARGESEQLVLSFPLPTALMLYGVYGIPVLFMLVYMVKFDSWILTPEDIERYRKLVKEKREARDE